MVQEKKRSTRQRRRDKRTVEILDAALEIVTKRGLEGMTIHRVADALDYTPGALYRYFKSKDALLAALQRRIVEEITESLAADLAVHDKRSADLPEAKRALGAVWVAADLHRRFLAQKPEKYHLVTAMIADPRPLLTDAEAKPVIAAFEALLGQLAGIFAAAQQAGALREGNPIERAMLFLASLQGVIQLNKLSRFTPALAAESLVPTLVPVLLSGWGGDPDAVAAARQATAGA